MRVDFPEPDGPHTTTRSRSATLREMSFSTCSVPNHLFTFSMKIAGGSPVFRRRDGGTASTVCAVWLIDLSLTLPLRGPLPLPQGERGQPRICHAERAASRVGAD